MSTTAKYAIVVAGGIGQRMGSKIPKQFLELKNRPILIRTLEALADYSKDLKIVLVIPESHAEIWENLCSQYQFHHSVTLVHGGRTRFQSVRNGLQAIPDQPGLVAIHDGVRPLIDKKLIGDSFEIAEKHGSAVAAIPLKSSIRLADPEAAGSLDRENYRLVQTPQTFNLELIKKSYKVSEKSTFTDDASVWEAAGHQVTLFEGSEKNLKITTIQDLLIAEVLMKL